MDVNMQVCVADNIKYLRKISGYTQEQIARKLHMHRTTYTVYESGKKMPSTDVIIDLARLYHVSVDTLLQGNRDKLQGEVFVSEKSNSQLIKLADIFSKLSAFSQGCLVERAQMLWDQECQNSILTRN